MLKSILPKSHLHKIISLNSIGVIIKIASGFIVSKLLAVYVGQAGVALIGNFRNFLAMLENLATLGFLNGIIKYIAENEDNKSYQKKVIHTLLITATALIFIILIVVLLFIKSINLYLFDGKFYSPIALFLFICFFPFYIYSVYATAIINGYNKQKQLIIISLISTVLSLLASIILIGFYRTQGALFATLFSSTIVFFISIYYLYKHLDLKSLLTNFSFDFQVLKQFSHYSIMFFSTALLSPIISIAIRKKIMQISGINQAGNWEALNRISGYYFVFITTLLTVYFLPKLSNNSFLETKKAINDYFINVIPLFFVGLFFIFIFRNFIIVTFLSKDFLGINELLIYQLIGDFFKACSFIFAYYLIAKKSTKWYVFFEYISMLILIISSYFGIHFFMTKGAVMAYALTYFVYFLMLFLFYKIKLNTSI